MTSVDIVEFINKKRNDFISQQIFIALTIVCVFLIFNPFIALFIISLLSVYFQIPKLTFLIWGSLALTLFFFFREYDVFWNASSDDVPAYIKLYFSNEGLPWYEVFTRFIKSPGDNEPLWHLPCWILLNVFNGGEKSFVFIHYWVIFCLLCFTMISISSRYYVILLLGYFFLTPVAIDSVFHIWRQQIASTVFLIGCNLYLVKEKKAGIYLIYLSVLFHLVCLYFLMIFLFFNFLRKRGLLEKKTIFFLCALGGSAIAVLAFESILVFLSSLNLDRIITYAENSSGIDDFRMFIVMSILMGGVFLSHLRYKNDNLNKMIIFITFVDIIMTLAFPFADSIFTRLAYFTVPLIGLYFVRWFILNFPSKWMLSFVIFVFISGAYRIIPLITEERASAQFLAYGHPLDPFMGIFKMLFFL
jgi:hypothetical protein